MLITRETDYALRMLRVLLDEEKHSAAEMAETELIPMQFAYQILRKLSAGELVQVRERRNIGSGYGEIAYLGDRYQISIDRLSDLQDLTDKYNAAKPEDQKAAMRDIVDFIYDDYRQVLLAPHKRMDIIVGSLLMTGAASVKNKDDNAGGIDLLNIDLPFKFIKPDTEDKNYFVTYLQQKLNELKSIYGTFPKMIMSRGTFVKNIIGSSEFGEV